ncbi:sesquiterpene synthase Cop-like [Rhododendron vialii]|uniref:sesquiterpene synthase Cop-like n=1 Tax=Rhododendron vialii TaxID=182163 RepID=UPI00265DFD9B|nr:sesquiterpene synthase Cop-like [Rhododendron vialii]
MDLLPDYMKLVYQAVLDAYNMIDEEMAKQGKLYAIDYAKSAVKDMTRGYLAEAKWYHEGYVPSFEEYMPTAILSGGQQALAITFLLGMGELATKEALDWLYTDPLIVQGASVVGRLMDDVVGHEFEQKRGHVASAVECYMKQHGVTEEEVIVEFGKQVTNAWKDMNSECLNPTAAPMPLLVRVLNLARVVYVIYHDGDIYTHSKTKLKEYVTSVLVDYVPI